MSSHPSARIVLAFTRAEWDLLVRLPGQVVIAATSAQVDDPVRTVAEGLAGIDAIAAGLDSPNQLVRGVVAAIYAESEDDAPVAVAFANRPAGLASVIISCRGVAAVLAARCARSEQLAYREWVCAIASRVGTASHSSGLSSVAGGRIGATDRRFLADMSAALGG